MELNITEIDDIDNLNYHQLLHYLVLAEEILGIKLNIEKQHSKNSIDFNKDNKQLGRKNFFLPRIKKNKRGDVSK